MNPDINIHPADELAAIREEIRILEQREEQLKAFFLSEGLAADEFKGREYTVQIVASTRETIDKNAMIEDLGRKAVEPYLRKTSSKSVRVKPTKG